jgi:hypothetical protein
MASLRRKGKVWYVRVRDESGRQREVKAGPDKSCAQSIARDLESKAAPKGTFLIGRPKGDVLNCCGKMPSLRRAGLPGSCNLPE